MRLEFKKGHYDEKIYNELAIESYLELFNFNIPFLSNVIIGPLTTQNATNYYQELENIKNENCNLDDLLKYAERLPNIESLLSLNEDATLTHQDLFNLGKVVATEELLLQYEVGALPKIDRNFLSHIKEIVNKYSDDAGQTIKLTSQANMAKELFKNSEDIFMHHVKSIEDAIFADTKIKLTYPYAKEIPLGDSRIDKIKGYSKTTIVPVDDYLHISIKNDDRIEKLESIKDRANNKFQTEIHEILCRLTLEIKEFDGDLNSYYQFRKSSIIKYILLSNIKKNQLVIPAIRNDEFRIENGRLPVLENKAPHGYVPLTLSISQGPTMLFGGNMSGKTTLLKTISFHLLLVQFGIPVPAKKLELPFPAQHNIHLKSSGDLTLGLSSFAEELSFFEKVKNYNYVLVDELFQSTNPTAGSKLAKLFASSFSSDKMFFIFSTFYADLLKIKKVRLLQMQGPAMRSKSIEEKNYQTLLKSVPFTAKNIDRDKIHDLKKSNLEQVKMALLFNIPTRIKTKIIKLIKDI